MYLIVNAETGTHVLTPDRRVIYWHTRGPNSETLSESTRDLICDLLNRMDPEDCEWEVQKPVEKPVEYTAFRAGAAVYRVIVIQGG